MHTGRSVPLPRRFAGGRRSGHSGFALMELLIAIGIALALVALLSLTVNTKQSKALALMSQMETIAGGMQRWALDMPCYPTQTGALYNRANAQNTFCGQDVRARWKTPYVDAATIDANGNLVLTKISDATAVSIGRGNNLNGSGAVQQWFLQAAAVDAEIAQLTVDACNGGTNTTGQNPPGKCLLGAGANADLATVTYIFSERF